MAERRSKSDRQRAIEAMREAVTALGVASFHLKETDPATSRALSRAVDRLNRLRHRTEDRHA